MSELRSKTFQLPPEQQAIRDRCFHPSGTFVEFPQEEIETTIPQRFEKIASLYPHRLAVKTASHELTFAQLNEAANRVAHAILQARGKNVEPVALLFEQGAPAIIALLGVLKAAKFYVALDPALPAGRTREIFADSSAATIVTNTRNLSAAASLAPDGRGLINIDEINPSFPAENPTLATVPEALAYVVYTSGSTGKPKGVEHNHRYVLYHVFELGNSFHICGADRSLLLFPWNFSGGGHIIYSTLLNGAQLFPFDLKAEGMDRLAALLIEQQITIYHSTATVLRQLLEVLNPAEKLPSLRLIRFGGEAFTAADVQLCNDRLSENCLMLNGLATTECGIVARHYFDKSTQLRNGNVPSGYAAFAKAILILDDEGRPLSPEQIGEIAVKSRYLSPGYWRQPKLTAAKFPGSPDGDDTRTYLTGDLGRMTADGCLYHLGRKDFQVKVRGYRIEVAEVEAALLQHAAVKAVVVVGRDDGQGSSQLVAYLVPTGKVVPGVGALRDFARAILPEYMIPAAFVFLDAFPLTPNGKIDRRLLPEPDGYRPALETMYVEPTTTGEIELARIWAEVLSLDRVGIHDNFFELGGHSLAAMRVVSRVIQSFRLDVPLRALFEAPTVSQMAKVIAEHTGKEIAPAEFSRLLSEIEAMSEDEARKRVGQKGFGGEP